MSDFEKELYEQPAVVARVVAEEFDHASQLAAAMRLRGVQYIVVAGRGTSDNAGVYGKDLQVQSSAGPRSRPATWSQQRHVDPMTTRKRT